MDYYSKWLEISPLKNKIAQEVQSKLEPIFSTHGIPETFVSDNMPFSSFEFSQFSEKWAFKIATSSPHYPKFNGLAEKAVGIAKLMLKKCDDSRTSVNVALLEYRNLPIAGLNVSPSQLIVSRKLRKQLPIAKSQLSPKVIVDVHKMLEYRQKTYKYYYDRNAKDRQSFQCNEKIALREKGEWRPGLMQRIEDAPRSYVVLNEKGNVVRRNAFHLKKVRQPELGCGAASEESLSQSPDKVDRPVSQTNAEGDVLSDAQSNGNRAQTNIVTQSGRISRQPEWLGI